MASFAFAFIDCEFGGLDPELHDITEIAVIVTDYRLAELAAARVEGARAAGAHQRRRRPRSAATTPAPWARRRCRTAPGADRARRAAADGGKTVVPAGQNVRMDVSFLERAYRAASIA